MNFEYLISNFLVFYRQVFIVYIMEEVCANKAEFQELKSVFFRMDQKMDALMEMVKKLSTKESASGVRDREAEKANSATVTVAEERPTIDDEVLSQFSDSGESKQLEIACRSICVFSHII